MLLRRSFRRSRDRRCSTRRRSRPLRAPLNVGERRPLSETPTYRKARRRGCWRSLCRTRNTTPMALHLRLRRLTPSPLTPTPMPTPTLTPTPLCWLPPSAWESVAPNSDANAPSPPSRDLRSALSLFPLRSALTGQPREQPLSESPSPSRPGWEKVENEVLVLKKQLEAATQRNSTLEDQISHLDGALKECVRQLRQVREEQEQKIQEAVVKKTHEWESTKAELETKLSNVHAQLQAAKSEASSVICSDLDLKLCC